MHEMHLRSQGCRERYASLAYGVLRSFLRHARSYTVTSVFWAKPVIARYARGKSLLSHSLYPEIAVRD